MAKEQSKDFNVMLRDSKDMPKTIILTDKAAIERYSGERMYFAPPIDYDRAMRRVPSGKVITAARIREHFAKNNNADFTCPMTVGIFISIVAQASHQRDDDETPYWRTLKTNGELNPKYPGGLEFQKKKLEEEGHTVIAKGRTNIKYYVKDYEAKLFQL